MDFTYISLFQTYRGFWESLKYKAQTSQKWKIIKMGKKTKKKCIYANMNFWNQTQNLEPSLLLVEAKWTGLWVEWFSFPNIRKPQREKVISSLYILGENFHRSPHMTDVEQHSSLHSKFSKHDHFYGFSALWQGLWIWKPNLEKEVCYLQ